MTNSGNAYQEETSPQDGFRLHRLEVYNWGTFDGKIWSIQPQGGTVLLTGANASGKSTLVDALATLLLPEDLRPYNPAASSMNKKKERSVRTYMLGVYGHQADELQYLGRTQELRQMDKTYSV